MHCAFTLRNKDKVVGVKKRTADTFIKRSDVHELMCTADATVYGKRDVFTRPVKVNMPPPFDRMLLHDHALIIFHEKAFNSWAEAETWMLTKRDSMQSSLLAAIHN